MSAPASSQPPPSPALPRKGPFSKRGDTSCANVVHHLHRLSRAGSLQAVQAWLHHVTSSKDFIPFICFGTCNLLGT